MAARTTAGTFGATAKRMARHTGSAGAGAKDAFPVYLDVPDIPAETPNQKMLNKAASKFRSSDDPCGGMFQSLLECVSKEAFKPGDCAAQHRDYFACVKQAKLDREKDSSKSGSFKYHVERIYKELAPPMRNKRKKPKSKRTRRFTA